MESYSVKLGDIVNCLDYKRIPISSKEREKKKGPYPYYGAQGIVDYIDNYIFDGMYMLVAEDGENLRSQNESIAQIVKGKYWVNNHAHILESNGKCDIRFVCYYLNTLNIRGYITGSAQPKLNQDNLLSIKMILPSLKMQKELADVLDKIDSKISLNTRMNAELEAMAKQLYDYWFVQFDFPDENGNPYKSSGGKMVYNSTLKREIPAGWEVSEINQICKINSDTITRNDNFKNIIYLDTSNLVENRIISFQNFTKEKAPSRAQRKINDKTILFSTVRPSQKHYGIMHSPQSNLIVSTGFATIDAIDKNDTYRIYEFLTGTSSITYFSKLADTAVSSYPSINPSDIGTMLCIMPPKYLIDIYNISVDKVFLKIEKNEIESRNLTHLRDSLLPMLMNGQVTVE